MAGVIRPLQRVRKQRWQRKAAESKRPAGKDDETNGRREGQRRTSRCGLTGWVARTDWYGRDCTRYSIDSRCCDVTQHCRAELLGYVAVCFCCAVELSDHRVCGSSGEGYAVVRGKPNSGRDRRGYEQRSVEARGQVCVEQQPVVVGVGERRHRRAAGALSMLSYYQAWQCAVLLLRLVVVVVVCLVL